MAGTARILAICGSTRKNSSNLKLLRKIAAVSEESFSFSFFEDIDKLPHFNPEAKSIFEVPAGYEKYPASLKKKKLRSLIP
ncbi:MAG TPA: NAD(P)H-dependent oxidoreductase, partial [Arachidicoccus soli]|nr:NAD(P)H-dependent oxidoreductase [Arachidicoccus soli]